MKSEAGQKLCGESLQKDKQVTLVKLFKLLCYSYSATVISYSFLVGNVVASCFIL